MWWVVGVEKQKCRDAMRLSTPAEEKLAPVFFVCFVTVVFLYFMFLILAS